IEPRLFRNHPGDDPGTQRLPGGEETPAQDHIHRQRLADGPRQPLSPAPARNEAEASFGLTELGGFGSDDEIACHRQLAPASQAEAGNSSDERRPERPDLVPAIDPTLVVHLDGRGPSQLFDVRAGSKRPFRATDDDAANRLAAAEPAKRIDERVNQLAG